MASLLYHAHPQLNCGCSFLVVLIVLVVLRILTLKKARENAGFLGCAAGVIYRFCGSNLPLLRGQSTAFAGVTYRFFLYRPAFSFMLCCLRIGNYYILAGTIYRYFAFFLGVRLFLFCFAASLASCFAVMRSSWSILSAGVKCKYRVLKFS